MPRKRSSRSEVYRQLLSVEGYQLYLASLSHGWLSPDEYSNLPESVKRELLENAQWIVRTQLNIPHVPYADTEPTSTDSSTPVEDGGASAGTE